MRKNRNRGVSLVQVMVVASLLAGLSLVAIQVMKQFDEGHKTIELRGVADNIQQRMKAATQSAEALGKSRAASVALSECVAKCLSNPSVCMSDTKCPATETPFRLVDASGELLVSDSGGFVDDGGHACDQATNRATCRWKSSATFKPKSSDTIAMNFKVEYAPSPGTQAGTPMKAREWTADIPLSQLATSGSDPLVTKSYVDAAVNASSGGCFETTASSCGTAYSTQATHLFYSCTIMWSGNITAVTSIVPCTTTSYGPPPGLAIPVHTIPTGQVTVRVCCPKSPSE